MKFDQRLTVLVIKHDAIERGLEKPILTDVKKKFHILATNEKTLNRNEVITLKKREWTKKWQPFPSKKVRDLSISYEAQKVKALLVACKSAVGGIELGERIKGGHFIAQKCRKSTIRGKYADYSQLSRLVIDENNVCYLYDKKNKKAISLAPNVFHSVSDEYEFTRHIDVYFPEFQALLENAKVSQIKDLISIGKKLLENRPPDMVHDFSHADRVWKNAKRIILQESLVCSKELVECCSYWHDINKRENIVDLYNITTILGYDTKTKDILSSSIARHGWKQTQDSIYEKVLFDADKLEYVSIPRWETLLQLSSYDHRLMKLYFEGLNKRLNLLPSRLHFDSTRIEYKKKLVDFLRWAKKYKLYINGKFTLNIKGV